MKNLKKASLTFICTILLICSFQANAQKINLKGIVEFAQLLMEDIPNDDPRYKCDHAIDNIILNITDPSNLFYLLLQGLYPGQWGDYGSCMYHTEGQFVLATIKGNFVGNYVFTRGAQGKYLKDFSSVMGFCIPRECSIPDMEKLNPTIISTMHNLNWTQVSIEYTLVTDYIENGIKQEVSESISNFVLVLFGLFALLAIIGAIIEQTRIGDIPQINYEELDPVSKFQNTRQYDAILLQRKQYWAQIAICFSFCRNILYLSQPHTTYNVAMKEDASNKSILKNLYVIYGLKGISMLYIIYGQTYYFTWYSVIQNPYDIQSMKNNFFFTLITGSFFAVPVLFFISGFTQSFSFLLRDDNEMFNKKSMITYYCRRILKFVPFNIFMVLLATWDVPYMGTGPLWKNYIEAIKPCQSLWWTHLFFINNLYPNNYDEMCMPWSWFLSAYIQLSLILPLLLLIYKKLSLKVSLSIFTIIAVFFYILNIIIVLIKDIGALPTFNENFYSQIYMKPWYHFNSYLLGIAMCLIYKQYLMDKNSNSESNGVLKFLTIIKNTPKIRYTCYLTGLFFMCLTFFGQYPYIKNTESWSLATQTFYSTFAYQVFLFGISLILLPSLIGKAQFIRFLFGGEFWILFAQLSYGLYFCVPLMIFIFYLGNSAHSLYIEYQIMFYYFCGNFLYSTVFALVLYTLVGRPFQSLMDISRDIKLVQENSKVSIKQYLKKDQLIDESSVEQQQQQ